MTEPCGLFYWNKLLKRFCLLREGDFSENRESGEILSEGYNGKALCGYLKRVVLHNEDG